MILFIVNTRDAHRLNALLELALAFPEPLTALQIATRKGIPAQFLSRLLAELAREGVVASRRGARGGVRLARRPDQLSLAELLSRVAPAAHSGLAVRFVEQRLAEARSRALAGLSLADLQDLERAAAASADYVI